jgi:hypothetical protein
LISLLNCKSAGRHRRSLGGELGVYLLKKRFYGGWVFLQGVLQVLRDS